MSDQTAPPLVESLIQGIANYVRQEGLPPGTRLSERQLAAHFRVSRTPVREALRHLSDRALVGKGAGGGYAVGAADAWTEPPEPAAATDEEAAYLRIAEDRLAGALPDRLSESELVRRYGLSRAFLNRLVQRMMHEGWLERLPGYGWAFTPVLNSAESYREAYRYRIVVEPAAILEPGFRADEAALLRCRAHQVALLEGESRNASPPVLFDANTVLHETIVGCANNFFMLDGLRRLNRIRRLMEYGKPIDREATARRAREHVDLIDLLLSGQLDAASDYMRFHLRNAARSKAGD